MATKVFISWSGPLAKKIAEELHDWIPKVLQSVQTYYTPDDIEKGTRWVGNIEKELSESELGILCLTRENHVSPWINFEAGALSKHRELSKVCPLLLDFDNTDLTGPLSIFQTTKFQKEEFKKLIASVNSSCQEQRLDQKTFDETFEVWWPKLEEKVGQILKEEESSTKPVRREQHEILEEILEIVRSTSFRYIAPNKNSLSELIDAVCLLREREDRSNIRPSIELLRIEFAVRRLCQETGNDELYKQYVSRRSYYHRFAEAKYEKNSSGTTDGDSMKTDDKNDDE
jgi:hypothetical protein